VNAEALDHSGAGAPETNKRSIIQRPHFLK